MRQYERRLPQQRIRSVMVGFVDIKARAGRRQFDHKCVAVALRSIGNSPANPIIINGV
jgi:hypothetical protein